MTRFLNIILVSLLVTAAIGVYSIKYEATRQAERVAKLHRAIDREKIAIATLKAEWAHLAQPERLRELSSTHTKLKPMEIEQVTKLSALPPRPETGDLIAKKLEGLGLIDPIATGSTP
jgi:cell division protein FtsL